MSEKTLVERLQEQRTRIWNNDYEIVTGRALLHEAAEALAQAQARCAEARGAALEEALLVCERLACPDVKPPWRAAPGYEYFEKAAKAIRALQSPARVAEGEPVREALSNLVSLLLQTMEPIGPMRDRKDYPPELQTAINVLRSSPESPAKEQPGEVAAMVRRLHEAALEFARDQAGVSILCSDAAAMIEKLGQGWIPVAERLPEEDEYYCKVEGKPCYRWCGANPCLKEGL